jgi:hypothetical protein
VPLTSTDAFRIPVEVCIAGEGAVIVPEFPEGDQKFLSSASCPVRNLRKPA